MLYPLTFQPILKERVWGGRKLEELFGKRLPLGAPIGESWEISERPGDASVIANGPLAGRDLRWLMEHHAGELLGGRAAERFPLLVKLLDAREKLSLQVHPPAAVAARLGGEPKTEMWFISDAEPGAELFVGLRRGVTRAEFERRVADGSVAECFHRIAVKPGDVMFLPSGRVHAVGGGIVIFEIQQNSDTTYRVFDWNRTGLDGRPRELHVAESLASIDFEDFEPGLVTSEWRGAAELSERALVEDALFGARLCRAGAGHRFPLAVDGAQIIGVVRGGLEISHGRERVALGAGGFALLPGCLGRVEVAAGAGVEFLHVRTA